MRKLSECLLDYSVVRLRALAAARGIELPTNNRVQAARFLADQMLRPDSVAEALEILNPQEREALETVQAAGGRVRADPFMRRFGEIRSMGDGKLMLEQPWLSPANITERLWFLGFLFKAFADYADERVAFLFIPTDLLPLLPPPRAQAGLPFAPQEAPAQAWRARDTASLDVCTFLAYLQNHQPRYVRGRGLSSQDEAAWLRRWVWKPMSPPPFAAYEPLRTQLLLRIAGRLKLVRKAGDRLKPASDAARAWLSASAPARQGQMYRAWVADDGWDELRHIPEIRCEGSGWSHDPVRTRQRLLDLLKACEAGTWYSLKQVAQTIRDYAPDFQRTGGDYETWYIRDVKTGQYLMGFEHWDEVEGRLIAQAVAGPLHFLGAVDLGWDAEGQDVRFALTEWGWAWLHGGEAEPAAEFAPIAVQDDGRIHWPADGNQLHRFQLERLAAWESDAEGTVYRITPASLARILGQGADVEAVVRFLSQASAGGAPESLLTRVRGWASRRGRARLTRTVLLEADSPEVLAEIRADSEIGPLLGEAVGPTSIRVPDAHWRRVEALLRSKGFIA
ncbi:MAG: helicase-associated domain-containing protein [Anaerolineae bacterium]|nr:helicase-associated domain-containing protein [Anaerolineae bacterium]